MIQHTVGVKAEDGSVTALAQTDMPYEWAAQAASLRNRNEERSDYIVVTRDVPDWEEAVNGDASQA